MITKTKVEKSKIVERVQLNGMDLVRVETESGEWGADYAWAYLDRPTDRRHKSETVVFLSEYSQEWWSICREEGTDELQWLSAHQNGQDTCREIGTFGLFPLDSREAECIAAMFALITWEMMIDQAA